jgi:hypothetical protein
VGDNIPITPNARFAREWANVPLYPIIPYNNPIIFKGYGAAAERSEYKVLHIPFHILFFYMKFICKLL